MIRTADVLNVARPAVETPGDLAVINMITGGVLVLVTGFSNRARTRDALVDAGYRVTSVDARTFTVDPPRHLRSVK